MTAVSPVARLAIAVSTAALLSCDATPSAGSAVSDTVAGMVATPLSTQALAESVYAAGAHDSAGVLFHAVLESARRRNDEPAMARALTWLGLNAMRQDAYGDARRLGREALALKLRLGATEELFQSYNALGLLAYYESRYADAIGNLEQAILLAEQRADTVNLAKAWTNRALSLIELGDYPTARPLLEKALLGARTMGDRRIEGRVLSNLGMIDYRTGSPARAFAPLEEARRLAVENNDFLLQLHVLGHLAAAHNAMGEPGRAIATLDTALRLSRDPERGSRSEEANTLHELAQTYVNAGDPRRALQVLHDEIAIEAEVGMPHERAAALRQIASIQAGLGNNDLADSTAREALATHRNLGTRLEVVWDHVVLAEIRHAAGKRADAGSHLVDAGRIARALGSTSALATVALAEARVAAADGRARDVIRLAGDFGGTVLDAGPDREWELHLLVSRAYRRIGLLDSAVAAGHRSLEAVERIRGEYGSAMLRTSYVADRSSVYGHLAESLVESGRVGEALQVADAARGRALLEHSRSTGTAPTARALAEEERQLLRQIDELTRLADEDAEAVDEMSTEVQRTRALLERTRGEFSELLQRGAPGDRPLVHNRLRLDSLQASIAADEVLLEFLLADSALLTFAVTRDSIVAVRTPASREHLASRVRVARELANQPNAPGAVVRTTFAALGEWLLGPAPVRNAMAGKRRVVIVPHADLVYLPFAALVHPATGRWLSDDFAVASLPGAAMMAVLRGRSTRTSIETVAAFAPFPRELPFTGPEVRAVRFGGKRSRPATGGNATEGAVREALGRADVVHLATHGTLNRANPLFSGIELARRVEGRVEDDGRLEVHEVLDLALRPALVFLSGCETGVGAAGATLFERGEDFATLSQAFLVAGAGNVVATLWKVRDDGAAEFARRFYAALGEGVAAGGDVVLALADAQRALRRDPRFAAPYYWAAYTVSGTGWLFGAGPNQVDRGMK